MSAGARGMFGNTCRRDGQPNWDQELIQMATDVISTCCSAPLEYAVDGQGPTAAAAVYGWCSKCNLIVTYAHVEMAR